MGFSVHVTLRRVLMLVVVAGLSQRSASADQDYQFFTFVAPDSTGTTAFDLNNSGLVTGTFDAVGGQTLSFLRDRTGLYTTFGVASFDKTRAIGINNAGTVVGNVTSTGALDQHAFIREADGGITLFDAPGAERTSALDINDLGVIVGQFTHRLGASRSPRRSCSTPRGTTRTFRSTGPTGPSQAGSTMRGRSSGRTPTASPRTASSVPPTEPSPTSSTPARSERRRSASTIRGRLWEAISWGPRTSAS